MDSLRPFHLAFPVSDLNKARIFYKEVLGCKEGRSDTTWVDFNFFGHQLVFHLDTNNSVKKMNNPVDGHGVPVPHFGIILTWDEWEKLAKKLKSHHIQFIIEPYIRFENHPGEQATLFIRDPNGLHLEFKAFKQDHMIFEK